MGYEVAASVTSKGVEDIIAKFNNTMEERITATTKEVMEYYSPVRESANVVSNVSVTLNTLKRDIASLKNQFRQVNKIIEWASSPTPTRNTPNPQKATYTWESDFEFRPYMEYKEAILVQQDAAEQRARTLEGWAQGVAAEGPARGWWVEWTGTVGKSNQRDSEEGT